MDSEDRSRIVRWLPAYPNSCRMQYHENVKLSTRDSEEYTGHEKLYDFTVAANPRSKKSSTARRFPLRTEQPRHFFLVFFSFLVEFHRGRGIEWRGTLYPSYPVLLQSPTTHIPCILQRFWHTLPHARIYSSQKHNIVIPEMTSKANSSHSPLFLGREHGNMHNFKLWKFVEN